jgi:hypothetical protein
MKKSRFMAALTMSALLLTGCSMLTPEPKQTPHFVMPEYDLFEWEESSIEEFVDEFPDLDTTFTDSIDEITVQRNGDLWMLGSGLTGFGAFDTWARESFAIVDDGSDREALIETDGELIAFSYRAAGDGFLAYFFVSD